MNIIAAVKVRGTVRANPDVRKTLALLRLFKTNHCVLLKDTPANKGMLKKVKDYITWGVVSKDTIEKMIRKRGRLQGNKRLSEENLKKYNIDINKLVDAIYAGKITLKETQLKPIFRLRPPRKGYERKGIKKPVTIGGALGERQNMDELLNRMI